MQGAARLLSTHPTVINSLHDDIQEKGEALKIYVSAVDIETVNAGGRSARPARLGGDMEIQKAYKVQSSDV